MDTDFHKIICNNEISNSPKAIALGNRIWVGCRCTVLKGTQICDDVVIAANSTVFGVFDETKIIIGGNPSKILKRNVTWKL
ncbi:acyltransferase [Pelosinus baikalensis]|uniref:Acyltransferase n=1 Tax=Pelosinus baikalensis TaxID=2892015 RepID=A0ABS8HLR8_9FIRM|nr:hypothetical protein [Pelosinus baikalensis]MCC5464128.1 hypothetical protein [Pelosinus baikalensis]